MKRNTKKWSAEEEQYLKENYITKGDKHCALFLGRSTFSIKGKAYHFNLIEIKRPVYTKEQIEKIVKDSFYITDVLKKLNLPYSTNFNYIKELISSYGIDSSHFLTRSDMNKSRTTPVSKYLIKGPLSITSTQFKNKLYASGLKSRECEFCGQGEIWRGLKMSLILDHIDGDHFNNEYPNLRILCANCNATLDTHCKKKTGYLKNKYKNLGYRRKKPVTL